MEENSNKAMSEDLQVKLTLYEKLISTCHASGLSRYDAKQYARLELERIYPESFGGTKSSDMSVMGPFWGRADSILNRYYTPDHPRIYRRHKKSENKLPLSPDLKTEKLKGNTTSRSGVLNLMIELAKTGFIPKAKYLEPLRDGGRVYLNSSYKKQLEDAGYSLTENEFGYVVKKIETEATRIEREAQARKAQKQAQVVAEIKEIDRRATEAKTLYLNVLKSLQGMLDDIQESHGQ